MFRCNNWSIVDSSDCRWRWAIDTLRLFHSWMTLSTTGLIAILTSFWNFPPRTVSTLQVTADTVLFRLTISVSFSIVWVDSMLAFVSLNLWLISSFPNSKRSRITETTHHNSLLLRSKVVLDRCKFIVYYVLRIMYDPTRQSTTDKNRNITETLETTILKLRRYNDCWLSLQCLIWKFTVIMVRCWSKI